MDNQTIQFAGLQFFIIGNQIRMQRCGNWENTEGSRFVETQICGENKDKISACVKRQAIKVNTLGEAVLAAYKSAAHGDFVILSPASASFDMFKNYKEKANCFKELVRGLKNGEN